MATIDMQTMRYINLLDSASRVKTRKCFSFNGMVVFAVPKSLVSQAIGPGANNVRKMQEMLGKRIRIIGEASGIEEAEKFIGEIVSPIKFKSIEVKDGTMFISSGNMQNKAGLMGRNKIRFEELELIVKDTFNLELKII